MYITTLQSDTTCTGENCFTLYSRSDFTRTDGGYAPQRLMKGSNHQIPFIVRHVLKFMFI